MGKQIDSDEFIRHTQNMQKISIEQNDKTGEIFFGSVLDYVNLYLDIFCKGE